jgi:hypothetical protein
MATISFQTAALTEQEINGAFGLLTDIIWHFGFPVYNRKDSSKLNAATENCIMWFCLFPSNKLTCT